MSEISENNIDYRHKKFDQSKMSRTSSSSSSSGYSEEYSDVKREIDNMEPVTFIENTTAMNLCTKNLKRPHSNNEQPAFSAVSEAKQLRRDTFTPSLSLPFATALPGAITAAVATVTAGTGATNVIPPPTTILTEISQETILNVYKYHGNMVRKFPKKERSPKDQERRNKNTIACRLSRRVKKLEHIAIEEQYKQFSHQAFEITEKAMRATAYLHELMRLLDNSSPTITEDLPSSSSKVTTSPAPKQEKKPFSVAFLVGKE